MTKRPDAASNVVPLKKNGPVVDAVTSLNLGKIKRAKEEFETASGSYRNVLKHAEGKGIHLAAAKKALSIIKSGKKDEWLEETGKVTEYLYAFGDGVAEAQMNFDFLTNPSMPDEEKARALGYHAGLRGEGDGGNPYGPGSPQYNQWINGLNDGRRERAVAEADDDGDELVKGDDDGPTDDETDGEGDGG